MEPADGGGGKLFVGTGGRAVAADIMYYFFRRHRGEYPNEVLAICYSLTIRLMNSVIYCDDCDALLVADGLQATSNSYHT